MSGELHCDMTKHCDEPVTMIDDGGYVYCAGHGQARQWQHLCRKLRAHELNKLRRGETLERY